MASPAERSAVLNATQHEIYDAYTNAANKYETAIRASEASAGDLLRNTPVYVS